jgi:hypothetical protein
LVHGRLGGGWDVFRLCAGAMAHQENQLNHANENVLLWHCLDY